MKLQRKGEFLSTRVQYIPLGRIRPNPQQPRRSFDEEGLAELAASIRSCGILQPLTVRRAGDGYELVAGERRLRAARIAGLREVPCLVAQVGEEDSALLALMENLQRRDLDCWEEAQAIARLISRYGLSQEEAARRLGRAQPTVANKLRLLRLPEDVRALLRENGLTERHARALLKVDDPEVMWTVLRAVTDRHLNVEQTESMIAHLLGEDAPADKHRRKVVPLFRDVRIFVNTVNKAIATMQASGIDAVSNKTETDDYIEFHVRIPKHTDESTTQSSANADKPA